MLPDPIPEEFYSNLLGIPDPENESQHVAKALEWVLNYSSPEDWRERRDHQARALYAGLQNRSVDPSGKGRHYDPSDRMAYLLFQADAYSHHRHNYDPLSGSAIIPIFDALGKRLDAVKSINGLDPRMHRLVNYERAQPDGPLFELLVASAYVLDGYDVTFIPEIPGGPKTPDFQIRRGEQEYVVECKRLSISEFVESERSRARELWSPTANALAENKVSALCSITFLKPLANVPDDYLAGHAEQWLSMHSENAIWQDEYGHGSIGFADLEPLKGLLASQDLLIGSTRFRQLLLGHHYPRSNFIELTGVTLSDMPRYASDIDLVVGCRYRSMSARSMDLRARDVKRHLARAYEQLPDDMPSIVHIGLDALEEPAIEKLRAAKITETIGSFEAPGKQLHWVFAHHFVPDSPPDQAWIFDETVQRFGAGPFSSCPLSNPFVLQLQPDQESPAGHWDQPFGP